MIIIDQHFYSFKPSNKIKFNYFKYKFMSDKTIVNNRKNVTGTKDK